MIWLADEGVSGAVPPDSGERFKAALALLEAGEAEALIFTKVDRASRCTEDFARLIRLSEEQDWRTGTSVPCSWLTVSHEATGPLELGEPLARVG
jgi:hypothetical protein